MSDEFLLGDGYVGADEYIGEDELAGEMIIGGRGRRVRGGRQVRQTDGGGILLEQLMPFEEQSVASAVSVDITARPQRPIRTERLAVPSAIAEDFTFSRLTIGQDNMFVCNGNVPCQLFSEVAVGMRLRGYTADLGSVVTLTVTNRSAPAATLTFRAAIAGTSIVRA